MTGSLPLRAVPTTGGDGLQISGRNFGPLLPAGASSALAALLAPSATYRGGGGTGRVFSAMAASCSVTVAHTTIVCLFGPGTGAGLAWSVRVGGAAVGQDSAPSAATTAYQTPVISTFSGAGVASGTGGGDTVVILGANFGPMSTPPGLIVASYGFNATNRSAPADFTATSCQVTVDHVQLTCATAPGAGTQLEWNVMVDGQRSTAATTAYLPPLVSGISGANKDRLSPAGGDVVVLTGTNFGIQAFLQGVTYGPGGVGFFAVACNVTTPHTAITCFAAPGAGSGHSWQVTVRGQSSAPALSLTTSYVSPSIVRILPPVLNTGAFAYPQVLTLFTRDLPLLSRSYGAFLQVGNGPPTLGPPWLRTLSLRLPVTAMDIAAATQPDGTLAVAVTLPDSTWAVPGGGALPPPTCDLSTPGWAPALPPATSAPQCSVPDLAGGEVGLRLLVVPYTALGAGGGGATVASATSGGGSYSAPSLSAAVRFAPPVVNLVVVSRPGWIGQAQVPCPFNATVLAPGAASWSCADPKVLQLVLVGSNFGGAAPGLTRQLFYCDDLLPGNCSSGDAWAVVPPTSPAPPLGSGPCAAGAPLWVASWQHDRIVGYTTADHGLLMVSLASVGVFGAPIRQNVTTSFSDVSPTISQVCVSSVAPPWPAGSQACVAPNAAVDTPFPPPPLAPFPCAGDPSRLVAITVDQLAGSDGLQVTVGGTPVDICDAAGNVIPPNQVRAVVLDTQGLEPPFLWTILFRVPPGQGRFVPIVVQRLRGGSAPAPSDYSATLDYAPPTLTSVVVTFPGDATNASSRVYAAVPDPVTGAPVFSTPVSVPTDGSAVVQLRGTNLGTPPTLLMEPASQNFTAPTGLTPCGGPAFSCWAFSAPAGEGAGWALALWQGASSVPTVAGGAPNPKVLIPWAYDAPRVFAVTSVTPLDPSLPPGLPTEGGILVRLTGVNFGRPWSPSGVAVNFGLPADPQSSWAACGSVARNSQTDITCVLPEGSGANLSLAINVAGVVGTSVGAFSYGAPVVSSVGSSQGSSPGAVVAAGAGGEGWAFPVLRGGTRGGAVVTLLGRNFGAQRPEHCAFLAWAGRPVPQLPTALSLGDSSFSTPRLFSCNGVEDWLGEGEVAAAQVLSWNHTALSFLVPPGLGAKEVQVSVRGSLIAPPRDRFTPTAPGAVPRFLYNDPQVFSMRAATPADALPPALVGTDGGVTLIINGSNFGPPLLLNSSGSGGVGGLSFTPLPVDCAVANPCAAALPTAYPVVLFHRYCVAPSKYLPGYGGEVLGASPSISVTTFLPVATTLLVNCNPIPASYVVSVTHDTIVFTSAPGLGKYRNASVVVLSAGWTSNSGAPLPLAPPIQQRAPSSASFSFEPPMITGFSPPIVLVRLPPASPPVVSVQGINFGDLINRTLEGVSNDVSAAVGNLACLPPPNVPALTPVRSSGVAMISCVVPVATLVGYNNVSISLAGQTGFRNAAPHVGALLVACDVGFFGRPNETCLPCPQPGAIPSLAGARCDGFLPYLPSLDGNSDGDVLLAVLGMDSPAAVATAEAAKAYTAPYDPRFTYPRPLPGWFNLNSSDMYMRQLAAAGSPANMAAACPAAFSVPGRDVCIVPCVPPGSCVGDNYCAAGYASKPPMFRCASCAAGFFLSAGSCIRCPDSPVALAVAMAILLIFVAFAGFYLNKRQVNIAVVSIGIDFFQVLAIFAQTNVQWPPAVLNLMRFLSAFNLNIEIVAPECLVPNLSYRVKFAFVMLMPLALAAVFYLMYLLLAFNKRCIRGIRDRREVFSHEPFLVSSVLVVLYIMYLYLTRTVMDVFDCTPTTPPDGKTYLKVVFEECNVPGGTQLTLLPWALAGLGVYALGYPYFIARTLWRNAELVMEDQLLRAKGVGNDRLTNPHALDLRQRFGRSYFQFKPTRYLWALAILARKFAIAVTAVMFSKSVGFQMASCLFIMFLAYSVQVQARPYMGAQEFADVLAAHEMAVLAGDPRALRLQANIVGVEARGRKRSAGRPTSLLNARGELDRAALLKAMGSWVFNYNTVEATMCFACVIVSLSGLMYQAEATASTGINGTLDAITGLIMFTVIMGIIYYLSAVAHEVYLGLADMRAAQARKKAGMKVIATSSPGTGGEGNLDSVVNPMFLRAEGDANLGANSDSLVSSIMAQKEPPPPALWLAFREEFASTVNQLKDAKTEALQIKAELSILRAMHPDDDHTTKKGGAKRTEFASDASTAGATGSAFSPLHTERREPGTTRPAAGSFFAATAGAARKGIFSTRKSPLSANAGAGEGGEEERGGGGGAATTNPLRLRALEEAAPPATPAEPPAAARADSPAPVVAASGPEEGAGGEGGDEERGEELPPGWASKLSKKGKRFYYNAETKETAWSIAKILR
jgi:hypothetical protein